jgi:hypothetical protein
MHFNNGVLEYTDRKPFERRTSRIQSFKLPKGSITRTIALCSNVVESQYFTRISSRTPFARTLEDSLNTIVIKPNLRQYSIVTINV